MLLNLRNLQRKVPIFCVALTTLAVSIGASVAMFTVVNRFLLSALPYENGDRLVMIWRTHVEALITGRQENLPLTPGDFTDLSDKNRSFEQLAGLISDSVSVIDTDEVHRVHSMFVVGDFFGLIRVKAALGRTLGPEDAKPNTPRVVAISHGYWQSQLGSDPEVIGRTLEIGGTRHEVVGVLPADFRLTESLVAIDPRFSNPVDLWAPLHLGSKANQRGFRYIAAVGRLRPGINLEAAQNEVRAYAEHTAEQYPDTDKAYGMKVVSLSDQIFGHLRPVLLALWAATGFVLLIACANLATLLLAQGQADHQDIAILLALGASRARVFIGLLIESVLLSLAGGLLSLGLALSGIHLLIAFNPVNLFHTFPPMINLRVFGFTIGLSLLAGLLFGGAPALRASRIDILRTLQKGSTTLSHRSSLVLSLLVTTQIALTTTLLIGTGLSATSFLGLLRADLGVNLESVVTLDIQLPFSSYQETPRKIEFFRELLERIRALPGVESVAMNYALPLSGVDPSNRFAIEGQPLPKKGQVQSANLGLVNPEYFETLHIPLIRGRAFRASDTGDAPLVAIVDERMVIEHLGGEDPIGRQISIASNKQLTIIGVVGSVKHDAFEKVARPYVYLPYQQRCYMFTSLAIRTRLKNSLSLSSELRGVVRSLDKGLSISNLSTLENAYRTAIAPQRFSLVLISLFAGVALFLSVAGIYSLMSFLAQQRRREAGIRLALGAEPKHVSLLIVKRGMALGLTGTVVGIGMAILAGRVMASFVYGIGIFDPLVFSLVPALTLLAIFLTCYLPSRSLNQIDPSEILRL